MTVPHGAGSTGLVPNGRETFVMVCKVPPGVSGLELSKTPVFRRTGTCPRKKKDSEEGASQAWLELCLGVFMYVCICVSCCICVVLYACVLACVVCTNMYVVCIHMCAHACMHVCSRKGNKRERQSPCPLLGQIAPSLTLHL